MIDSQFTYKCLFVPIDLNSYLRFGSYPVVSIDNINTSFPNDTLLPKDLGEYQYAIETHTNFQPKEMPQIDIINPLPGSWFAVAFIVGSNDEAIQPQVKRKPYNNHNN